MSNIRIDIASEFKDKGFKKASKATTGLERQFKTLGRTLIAVFSARQIIRFTQDSVRAFAAEDRAVRALSGTLNNLGLAFQGANLESFVSEMQRTTAVSDGELRPALQSLANATLNVQQSQKLLSLALDISAATGKDLNAVVNGLTKAYLKDVEALARLNLGLTAAELKTMSFAEAQAALTERFGGQAAAAADSYQGKIAKLGIAFDEAQEVVGQRFIEALETLSDGNFDKVIDAIAKAADFVGDGFTRAAFGVQKLKAAFGGDFDKVAKLQEQMNLQLMGGFSVTARPVAGVLSRQMQQQSALLKRLETERRKAAEAEKKRLREQQQLKRAGSVFDIENIQIVAALQGKIDEEQRLRLTALFALNNDNAKAAEELTKAILASNKAAFEALGVTMEAGDTVDKLIDKIIKAQTKLFLVNTGLVDLPEAKNPFDKWPDIIAGILAGISQIGNAINNLPTAPGNPLTNPPANNPVNGPLSRAEFEALQKRLPPELRESYEDYLAGFDKNKPNVGNPTNELSQPGTTLPTVPDTNLPTPGNGDPQPVSIYINVGGSVVTENDLVSSITNAIYNRQKSGQPINYTTSI